MESEFKNIVETMLSQNSLGKKSSISRLKRLLETDPEQTLRHFGSLILEESFDLPLKFEAALQISQLVKNSVDLEENRSRLSSNTLILLNKAISFILACNTTKASNLAARCISAFKKQDINLTCTAEANLKENESLEAIKATKERVLKYQHIFSREDKIKSIQALLAVPHPTQLVLKNKTDCLFDCISFMSDVSASCHVKVQDFLEDYLKKTEKRKISTYLGLYTKIVNLAYYSVETVLEAPIKACFTILNENLGENKDSAIGFLKAVLMEEETKKEIFDKYSVNYQNSSISYFIDKLVNTIMFLFNAREDSEEGIYCNLVEILEIIAKLYENSSWIGYILDSVTEMLESNNLVRKSSGLMILEAIASKATNNWPIAPFSVGISFLNTNQSCLRKISVRILGKMVANTPEILVGMPNLENLFFLIQKLFGVDNESVRLFCPLVSELAKKTRFINTLDEAFLEGFYCFVVEKLNFIFSQNTLDELALKQAESTFSAILTHFYADFNDEMPLKVLKIHLSELKSSLNFLGEDRNKTNLRLVYCFSIVCSSFSALSFTDETAEMLLEINEITAKYLEFGFISKEMIGIYIEILSNKTQIADQSDVSSILQTVKELILKSVKVDESTEIAGIALFESLLCNLDLENTNIIREIDNILAEVLQTSPKFPRILSPTAIFLFKIVDKIPFLLNIYASAVQEAFKQLIKEIKVENIENPTTLDLLIQKLGYMLKITAFFVSFQLFTKAEKFNDFKGFYLNNILHVNSTENCRLIRGFLQQIRGKVAFLSQEGAYLTR